MRSLGVKAVISPCAAGSLQLAVEPGHFVVSDQFVDRTTGREDTFFDGPIVSHVSSAETYDPTLRRIALDVIREHGITVHDGGTVVVIQGPRFSTKAESKWFSDAGWQVINMTQYPEAYLCRELGMAVVNIALITDYDAGVLEGTEAVTAHDVLAVFEQNAERIRAVVLDMVGRFPADLDTLGRPRHAGAHPRRRARRRRRRHPDLRDGAAAADRMTSMPTTPTPAAAPAPSEPMHGCVRCGARIPISESMCERCNPLGLKAPAASQAHGTAILGVAVAVVMLAVVARFAVAGIGPLTSSLVSVGADPAGLRVTISITNAGSNAGATTCRIGDPRAARDRARDGVRRRARSSSPGRRLTFEAVVTSLGTTPRPLNVDCAP